MPDLASKAKGLPEFSVPLPRFKLSFWRLVRSLCRFSVPLRLKPLLDGVFRDEHGVYPKGSWLRSPHLSQHTPFTGPEGALIYVKTGHLPA